MKKRKSILTNIVNLASTMVLKSPKTRAMTVSQNPAIQIPTNRWAFSWIKGNLSEMFAWYKDHADYIKMHNNTRSIVEEILEMIRTKLTEVENAEN